MAVYRVVDEHILAEGAFRAHADAIATHLRARQEGNLESALALPNGAALAPTTSATGVPGFTPIGKGLPLTVLIRHVYTGRHPDRGFLSLGSGDVAVVSGVKDFDVFGASARALNFIARGASAKSHLGAPGALSEGTAVVAYSPAVLADSITLTVELAVAEFPQELVSSLSGAFNALAGLPILMPYSGYLLGAAQVLRLGGELGHALLDGPVFSITDPLNFDLPGSSVASADFRVLAASTLRADRFQYRDGVGLVDRQGNAYGGEEPYVVVSLDGRKNAKLENFAPTVASAAVLSRFFQIKDGQQAAIDTFVEGMRLASDFKYRQRAQGLQAEIAAATGESEKQTLQDEFAAVIKNISTEALRLPAKS